MTISMPRELFWLAVSAVASALVVPTFLLFFWPWRRIRKKWDNVEARLADLADRAGDLEETSASSVERIAQMVETVREQEERVVLISEKVGLKGDLLSWSKLMLLEGKLEDAISTLTDLLAQAESAEAHYYRGKAYLEQAKKLRSRAPAKKALEDLQNAAIEKSSNARRVLDLATAYLLAGDGSEAERWGRRALELGVDNPVGTHVLVANACCAQQQYEKAIAELRAYKFNSDAMYSAAKAMLLSARSSETAEGRKAGFAELVSFLTSAIQDHPRAATLLLIRGQAYAARGGRRDHELAIADFRQCRILQPGNVSARVSEANLLVKAAKETPDSAERQKLLKGAIKLLNESVSRSDRRRQASARNWLSRAYLLLGDYDQAVEEARSSAADSPMYWMNHIVLAQAAVAARRWEEGLRAAENAARTAKKVDSEYGIIWALFFLILAGCGYKKPTSEIRENLKSLEQTLAASPSFSSADWDWEAAVARVERASTVWEDSHRTFVIDAIQLLRKRSPSDSA